MKQSNARIVVYSIWFSTFVVAMFGIQFASAIRRNVIDSHESQNALVKIAALYIPILTAFATFWFRKKSQLTNHTIARERWWGAISITLFYQLFLITRIIYINYLEEYNNMDGQPASTYLELMSAAVEMGLLLSPLAVLPVAFLLGVEELSVADAEQD